MQTFIIINKNHRLFPEQVKLMETYADEWTVYPVPEKGYSVSEMNMIYEDFVNLAQKDKEQVMIVFASPIPYLLKMLALYSGLRPDRINVKVFHNDLREAKEVPDGKGGKKLIHVVSSEGWRLL